MENIYYTKKANNNWKFTIRKGKKYQYSKSGFTEKEEVEEEDQKAIKYVIWYESTTIKDKVNYIDVSIWLWVKIVLEILANDG